MSDQDSTRTLVEIVALMRDAHPFEVRRLFIDGLTEIDRRLTVLELCPKRGGTEPHLWQARRADGSRLVDGDYNGEIDHSVCGFCGVRR